MATVLEVQKVGREGAMRCAVDFHPKRDY